MATLQITKDKTTGKVAGWLIGEGGALSSPNCETITKDIDIADVPKIIKGEYEPKLDANNNLTLVKRQWLIEQENAEAARKVLKEKFESGMQTPTDVIEAIKRLL